MSYRFMRIIVFFDLPTYTYENRREYTKFRRFLIQSGFLMLQESVYCKLALNTTISNALLKKIKNNKPKDGLVQVLTITEKQFSRMEIITGTFSSDVLDTDERLVIL